MKQHKLFFKQYYKMYRPFVSQLNHKLAQHDLYSSQYAVLLLLKEGGLTLGEISQLRSVERPTITRTVQHLKSVGYVEVKPGKDRREKNITLTELGINTCIKVENSLEDFQLEALQGIKESELHDTIETLTKVHRNLINFREGRGKI